ncbi:MAG: A/G-specific adenine glycosylase, partial [Bdellovibrionales bacterium]|nr:A/G-specific adenine glycosylase [Bdellovibrionales bacterium]
MKSTRLLNRNGQRTLVEWFKTNHRPLPWRVNRDPYRIWISEVMLQQTTSRAVQPFFERFLKRFPNLKSLSQAKIEDVYEVWAGLGYYSRARNLLKTAQILGRTGFPKTFEELLKLPGLGPYTARSISSLAFEQRVGVLDGNVIRVLSRLSGEAISWWTTEGRTKLQGWAD